jgi:integrase
MRNAAPDRTSRAAIRMVGTLPVTSFAAGVPLPNIQQRLGHESITTTIDTYGHLLPQGNDLIDAALDAGLGGEKITISD